MQPLLPTAVCVILINSMGFYKSVSKQGYRCKGKGSIRGMERAI